MTNLEYRKEFIQKNKTFCQNAHILKYHRECGLRRCEDCEFRNVDECLKVMLGEHEETIKLKQWEKDLLKYYDENWRFYNINVLKFLQKQGHFKGIIDTSMTLVEILDNCEDVDD